MTGGISNLGFEYKTFKNGEVEIRRFGKRIAVLRKTEAEDFLDAIEHCTDGEIQMEMARITGNYKHGNERRAADHPRNR